LDISEFLDLEEWMNIEMDIDKQRNSKCNNNEPSYKSAVIDSVEWVPK